MFSNDRDNPERFSEEFETQWQRQQFIQRVFALLTLGLVMTVVQAFVAMEIPAVTEFLFQHYWIILVAFIVYTVCSLTIHCCQAPRKTFPVNLIIFMLLVESMTIIVCVSVIVYDRQTVLLALLSTVGVFFVVLLISLIFKIDFTTCTGVLCLLFTVLLTFGLVLMVAQFFMDITLLSVIYSFLAVSVISFYMLFILQMIFGGKTYELETDEYILGATLIYSNLILIFLHLMRIFNFFK